MPDQRPKGPNSSGPGSATGKTGAAPKAAEVRVAVNTDLTEATLQLVIPPKGAHPTRDEIHAALTRAGVVHGVDEAAFRRAQSHPGEKVVCARGRAPRDGADARVKLLVDTAQRGHPAALDHGRVDLHELSFVNPARAGDVVAELVDATHGEPGINVHGEALPARPGKGLLLVAGENTELVNGRRFRATAAGHVTVSEGRVSVITHLEIPGDVDMSRGNIHFPGDVTVNGSVHEGLKVQAEGDVTIHGGVYGACIEGRNITISQGVVMGPKGLQQGMVRALGNLTVRFIENAEVLCDGDVVINDSATHSTLVAGGRLTVQGQHGLIVGCRVSARLEIRARTIGREHSTASYLEVGVDRALRDVHAALHAALVKTGTQLEETDHRLERLSGADGHLPSASERAAVAQLGRTHGTLSAELDDLRHKDEELAAKLAEGSHGCLRVENTAYPGTVVTIGPASKTLTAPATHVAFHLEEGAIKADSFDWTE